MDSTSEDLVKPQDPPSEHLPGKQQRWALLYAEKIPWRRVLVEFVAIFTAVLLSFMAEDWREHLGDRRKEAALLRGLLQDLETG